MMKGTLSPLHFGIMCAASQLSASCVEKTHAGPSRAFTLARKPRRMLRGCDFIIQCVEIDESIIP